MQDLSSLNWVGISDLVYGNSIVGRICSSSFQELSFDVAPGSRTVTRRAIPGKDTNNFARVN